MTDTSRNQRSAELASRPPYTPTLRSGLCAPFGRWHGVPYGPGDRPGTGGRTEFADRGGEAGEAFMDAPFCGPAVLALGVAEVVGQVPGHPGGHLVVGV